MYVPKHFAQTDVASLHALVRAHSFATLVSVVDGELFATHVPLLLDADRGPFGTLVGHVARANPHARAFEAGARGLAIFHGPHAYVSPRWYAAEPNVPTWNYLAVHASGPTSVMAERDAVRALLVRSAGAYETGAERPWSLASIPEAFATGLQKGIVAFELAIDRIEGKRKLSQNKTPADRAGVIAALRERGGEDACAIADAMEVLA